MIKINFMRIFFYFFLLSLLSCTSSSSFHIQSADWQEQQSGIDASIRGICAVDNQVAWISGSGGQYSITTDGGDNWIPGKVPGADSLDFRDVEAFSADLAYLMSIGPGQSSRIYKTTDGGQNWTLQHQNELEAGFFDGFAFWDDQNAILIGDPIDGKLYLMKTTDGGQNWLRIPPEKLPPLKEGEYGFAASGTGITVFEDNVWICTGGQSARVFHSPDRGESWNVYDTPVISGKASAGTFSVDFRDAQHGVVVGGDYNKSDQKGNTFATTDDGGKTWLAPADTTLISFRSCVQYLPNSSSLISVGRGGVSAFSNDDGKSWTTFGALGLYTLSISNDGQSTWAAGPEGRVAKLVFQ